MTEETVQVQFVVTSITSVSVGKIVALAEIELSISDIPILTVSGIQVHRTAPNALVCAGPTYKSPTGVSEPAVILAEPLPDAIARAVIDAYEAMVRQRSRRRLTAELSALEQS